MPNILIAGCGYVGQALAKELLESGNRVYALCRRPESLPSNLEPLKADLRQQESLKLIPQELDYVFFTAAAAGHSENQYREVYLDGLKNLISQFENQGYFPKRFIFTSSTAVYAQQDASWVDEQSATTPEHFSGRIMLEAEKLLLNSSMSPLILRLGGIYGPGRTRLIESVRQGKAAYSEGPPIYTNRIHRDDCAKILLHLMTLIKPEPIYIGVDNEPTDKNLVLTWLAEQLSVSLANKTTETPPSNRGLRSNKRCSNKLLRRTGYRLEYPSFREGYKPLLA